MLIATYPDQIDHPLMPRSESLPSVRTLDSRNLFGSEHEIRIAHEGQEYRLRVTRNGKLILTK
jgi:hemin uptake protein HemP